MNKEYQVLLIGFLIRFLIPTVFPEYPLKLASSVELSTPINSYASLQESFFYLDHDINGYDGGVNHHPPLLVGFLYMFKESLPSNLFPVFINFLYAVIDVVIALRLVKLNIWYNEYNSTRRQSKLSKLSNELILSFYLFNPILILTNLAHSTLIFTSFFLIESLHQLVTNKNLLRPMICLALASYLSFTPLYLIFPILALSSKVLNSQQVYVKGVVVFIASIGLLLLFSAILTLSFEFINQCYGIIIRFDKIQPNIGLWWYFFTEMFDFFTPFYIGVFNLFEFIFILPISIRLYEYGNPKIVVGDLFLAVFLCYIWLSFTKSYPTIGDLGLGISLSPIFCSTIFPHCKLIYITGITLIISLLLSPIFYYCWIVLGNGNSNFFYSINLIWGGVHILILIDFIWAKLVSDYCDIYNVEEKDIRLTQD